MGPVCALHGEGVGLHWCTEGVAAPPASLGPTYTDSGWAAVACSHPRPAKCRGCLMTGSPSLTTPWQLSRWPRCLCTATRVEGALPELVAGKHVLG